MTKPLIVVFSMNALLIFSLCLNQQLRCREYFDNAGRWNADKKRRKVLDNTFISDMGIAVGIPARKAVRTSFVETFLYD